MYTIYFFLVIIPCFNFGLLGRPAYRLVSGNDSFDATKHKNWKFLDHETCGEGRASEKRIIGGTHATLGEKPWLARIGYTSPDFTGISYRCGGAVLGKNLVITAAHCVSMLPADYVVSAVVVGEHFTNQDPDCEDNVCAERAQVIKPAQIITHSDYNVQPFKNDIALVRLAKNVQFHDFVKPICLVPDSSMTENLVGKHVEVAGWGIYDIKTTAMSEVLQKVSLTVKDNDLCVKEYRRHAPIGPTQLCVGGEIGKDSCGGDSGGPLMMIDSDGGVLRVYMIGIVSFGSKKCGATQMPGVYTRLSSHMSWIMDNLKENRVKYLTI